jgi:hypothetical protein
VVPLGAVSADLTAPGGFLMPKSVRLWRSPQASTCR